MSGFKKDKKPEEAELDITPMIDVTFLLLIFFMVTSTMEQQKQIDVPPAKHGVGAEASNATFVTILANEGGLGRVLLGDGADGEEVVSMDRVARFVQQGLNEGRDLCIVKAERDVTEGRVQEVLRAAGEIDGMRFAVGVQAP